MYKVTNKSFQPQLILVDGNTVVIGARQTVTLDKITKQMTNLKTTGVLKIKKDE
jgi:short-subunit dehydrogenase involved in D-alanine esterification of teichoic acids